MSVLLLVRHGQASWGEADYDRLSPRGVEQSRLLGAALAGRAVRPDVVLRGSLRRHEQSADAAIGGAGWEVPVVEDAGWDEFDHMRTLSGAADWHEIEGETYDDRVLRFEATIERWASGQHDADYHESFPVFTSRVEEALARALDRLEPKQTAVVFTSGGPVSWVTAALTDGGAPAWGRLSKVVVNSSVTKVVDGRRGTNLISFNDHAHLEGVGADLLTYR